MTDTDILSPDATHAPETSAAAAPADSSPVASADPAVQTTASDADAAHAAPTTEANRARRSPRGGRQGPKQGQGHNSGQGQAQGPRPARKVHPVLEQLFGLYPKMFGARFLPLKLGVFQDLMALHPELFKKDDLKVALGLHARSTRYLEAVAAGLPRSDLQGEPIEPVAPEHVHHAVLEVFKRRQSRSADDLRPHVIARIVTAIEASGLSREDYDQRVRSQDEANNALLDEALATVSAQAAKREALLRAFEASGKTEAEFADMYGMDPKEVADTLNRARAHGAN